MKSRGGASQHRDKRPSRPRTRVVAGRFRRRRRLPSMAATAPPPILLVCLLLTSPAAVQAQILPEELTEDVVKAFLNDHDISTVDALVKALPPLHKRHFLSVFDSAGRSAAFTSLTHPRIISWGADSRFILSWSTSPTIRAPTWSSFSSMRRTRRAGLQESSTSRARVSNSATPPDARGATGR